MRASKTITTVFVALFAALLVVGPASAAPGGTINSITRVGCVLTINVTVEDAGTYWLAIYDDGPIIGTVSADLAEGATHDFTYTIVSNINQGAPGIGIVLQASEFPGSTAYASVDPYDFPGSDDIATACADSGGEDSGEGPDGTIPDETVPDETVPGTTVPAPPAPSGGANAPAPVPAPAPAAAPAAAVAARPTFTG